MTETSTPPPNLAKRILALPPLRVPVLGFVLLVMMGLSDDVMKSYAAEPTKAASQVIALAIAGVAVYLLLRKAKVPAPYALGAGFLTVVSTRLVAIALDLRLPTFTLPQNS